MNGNGNGNGNDFDSNYQQLLSRGNHVTVHQKNLRTLSLKLFKAIKGHCPRFIKSMFTVKTLSRDLRIKNLFTLPEASTITYGLHSFTYRASSTWNNINDKIKESPSVPAFKRELKQLIIKCSCKLCHKP